MLVHINLKSTFFFLFLSLTLSHIFVAQAQVKTIIEVTDQANTMLIFDTPIERGIVGNRKFSFSYDKSNPSTVGLLKGVKGDDTNLMIITTNGNLYNFKLKYKKEISKTSYFIKDSLAEGNINGKIVYQADIEKQRTALLEMKEEAIRKSKPLTLNDPSSGETSIVGKEIAKEKDSLYLNDKIAYVQKFASNLTSKKDFFLKKFSEQNEVFFHLKDYHYNKNELYFAFKIDNTSGLDFDIREVEMYLVSQNNNTKTSTQKIPLKPLMIYNQPSRVEGHKSATFVYVFDKFSIGDKKSIECELIENRGERNISLVLDDDTINNPN